jgi:hypothetical protein
VGLAIALSPIGNITLLFHIFLALNPNFSRNWDPVKHQSKANNVDR